MAPHHFPNPASFVNESARVLRAGGRFVLVDSIVPAGEVGAFFNRFEKLRDPSHVRSLTIKEWTTMIAEAGLTHQVNETFTKRHNFAAWTARSRMSKPDRDALAQVMIDASAEIRASFRAEIVDGELVSFTDARTLFLATKSEG